MKKFLKNINVKKLCMLLSFVIVSCVSLTCGIKDIKASSRVSDEPLTYHGRKVMYWRYYNLDDFKADSWADGSYYEVDGITAYCIEPGVHTEDGLIYPNGTTDGSETGLDDETIKYISLLAYYGYGYGNHNSMKWYMATQGLIWDELLNDKPKTTYWYYAPNQNDDIDISDEQDEILDLVKNHYKLPSFNRDSYNLQVGESITLTDTKKVLEDFEVSVSGADFSIDNNSITITPTKAGTLSIKFTKKQVYNESTLFYYSNKYQDLMTMGNVDPAEARVTINAYYGAIELNKSDSETGVSQGQATLKSAKYGVYNLNGELLTTIETNSNGYGKSESVLSYGSYYVQEIEPSTGYFLDHTRYNIDVKGTTKVTMNVQEDVVKNYISILKQYEFVDENTTFLNAESGITFEIYYPNGNLYDTIVTDKNGYASLEIPYGVWRFHQVNTTTGYEKIYDFNITVDYDSEKEQYYNILNNALSAYLKVVKVDEETGKTIAIANTTFKILNLDTNQYVTQFVGGQIFSEFTTDESGTLVTYLKLSSGNYKLIEVSSPEGYILDKEGLSFTIGEDTHYSYTTYGPFVTIKFKNSPIKGQIEISKNGEEIKIENGTFNYNNRVSLEEIVYNIYADEEIKSPDGSTIFYSKGDLVETIITNENGYAISKKLPLGKYKVIEVETLEDYILDKNEYFVELIEKDNQTAIVYSSLQITNFLKKGTLEFTKKDLVTGEEVPNTLIEVYTENNELVFSGRTDANGKVLIENLKIGKYYILEKEASTGYLITEEKIYFEIKEDGEIIKAEMKNQPITGKLEFTKVDFSTGEALPNTLIEIYNENDELIFSGRTDEKGMITIENLRYGKYYILEKEAPKSYNINPEKHYFEIKENGEIVKVTMTDDLILTEVPNTGKNTFPTFELSSFLLLGFGAGIWIYAKTNKNKK